MNISRVKRLSVLILVLSLCFIIHFSGIYNHITIIAIQKNIIFLQKMINLHYFFSVFSYIFLYVLTITFSLPIAALLTVVGGFFFGTLYGAVYANIGATVGSTCSFLLVRYVFGKSLQKKYKQKLKKFNNNFNQYGVSYLIVVHSIIIIPLFLVNILAGLTEISVLTFMWATSIAIFPTSLVYAFAGQQFHIINSIKDIFSINIIGVFILLGLVSLLPLFIKRIIILGRSKKKL